MYNKVKILLLMFDWVLISKQCLCVSLPIKHSDCFKSSTVLQLYIQVLTLIQHCSVLSYIQINMHYFYSPTNFLINKIPPKRKRSINKLLNILVSFQLICLYLPFAIKVKIQNSKVEKNKDITKTQPSFPIILIDLIMKVMKVI